MLLQSFPDEIGLIILLANNALLVTILKEDILSPHRQDILLAYLLSDVVGFVVTHNAEVRINRGPHLVKHLHTLSVRDTLSV